MLEGIKSINCKNTVSVPLKHLPATPSIELILEKARPVIESNENGTRRLALAIVNVMLTLTLSAFFKREDGEILSPEPAADIKIGPDATFKK